jgi:hypothetical protein
MQILPSTGRNPGYGVKPLQNDSPEENVRFGTDYYSALVKKYGGDEKKALLAWNAGPGTVDRAQGDISKLPKETQSFGQKVARLLNPLSSAEASETPYRAPKQEQTTYAAPKNKPNQTPKSKTKIAKFGMPDGRVAKFEVPGDYTQEQAMDAMNAHFKQQDAQVSPSQSEAQDKTQDTNPVTDNDTNVLAGIGQYAKDNTMGALKGAAEIGSTLVQPLDWLKDKIKGESGSNTDRRSAIDQFFKENSDDNSLAFGVGEFGAGVAGTLGVGGLLGKGVAKVAPGAIRTIKGLETGGITTGADLSAATGKTKVADALIRASTGGVTGAGMAGLIDPELTGSGAIGGAIFPAAVSTFVKPVGRLLSRSRSSVTGAGAADTPQAIQRKTFAENLPVPMKLTKGQASRDYAQQQFERETAKNNELGKPIRERMDVQRNQVVQNMDAWNEQTGGVTADVRDTGISVHEALAKKAADSNTKIGAAYAKAEAAGELRQPVQLNSFITALNDSVSARSTAPVLVAAKDELIRLGGAKVIDGKLVAQPMTLADSEYLRKFINNSTGSARPDLRHSSIIKKAMDADTENAGGDVYKRARVLRTKHAKEFENQALIDKLLTNKRNTSDRKVAFEDVHRQVVLNAPLDQMRGVKRSLLTQGAEGQQAWKNLQGETMEWLKNEGTKGVGLDSSGNRVVSASGMERAVNKLDKSGKLDFLFGKPGAESLRDMAEHTKTLFTSPEGAVNTSNTASGLLNAIDYGTGMMVSGGWPVNIPLAKGGKAALKYIKNRKTLNRIKESLQ